MTIYHHSSKWIIGFILFGIIFIASSLPQYQYDPEDQLSARRTFEDILEMLDRNQPRERGFNNENDDDFAEWIDRRREEVGLSFNKRGCSRFNEGCGWFSSACCGRVLRCSNQIASGHCGCPEGFTLNYNSDDCVSAG